MSTRVGIDIGGTFTDFTVIDENGNVRLWKEDSTPQAPLDAIERGLNAIAAQEGGTLEEFLGRTETLVHGSTIATNTLIQKDGPPIGLLCTEGFRDAIYFRDGFKPQRFNMHLARPYEFVERHLRIGVKGRINADGEVLEPLSEADVVAAAEYFRRANVGAIAVAFLWSIVNDEHERAAAEILSRELPGTPILCSTDVLPEIREWERTSSTVLSAYVLPKIGDYLRELEALLEQGGMSRRPQIMQCNGGCASVDEIMSRPVSTLHSGPAAAPSAALHYAREIGSEDLIAVDMGGTSFDVCLIREGKAAMSRGMQVEEQPIGVPGVEVHSIGAGGGSIAWIDDGGALRVGPRSAGARPGPAAYDAGGIHPTVTDANIVLGYLSPEAFLGGRRTLRADLAEEAVRRDVADPLGLDVTEAAAGIIQVVNASMVGGIRTVSVERGIDPRGFVLVSGGGAGGLHSVRLARQLGMRRVVIPRETSTFCAFGMTVTDVRHEYTRSHFAVSTAVDISVIDGPFQEMEAAARERLLGEGFGEDEMVIERSVDARYQNQVHELTITIPSRDSYGDADLDEITERFHEEHARSHVPYGDADLDEITSAFHAAHEQQYTYSMPEIPIEFLHWRLTAVGRIARKDVATEEPVSDPEAAAEVARTGVRMAYFEELEGKVETPVYDPQLLRPGACIHGQALLESETTTIVINPGDELTVGADGTMFVDVAL